MKRRKSLGITGATIIDAGSVGYMLSDKSNYERKPSSILSSDTSLLKQDEKEILYLASLAPSGHNTQPWFVKYLEPYHYIICNDKSKWLTAVDSTQRETILSIGAFLQNFEYAASYKGYNNRFEMKVSTNQDENVVEVWLYKSGSGTAFDVGRIKLRRTVRSNYLNDLLK